MSAGAGDMWYERLAEMLQSPSFSDGDIVSLIEESIPEDESHIFDCKMEDYVSASDNHLQKTRRGEMAERFAALANVRHPSPYRFVFVGFDDNGNFVGIENRGAEGGKSVFDADDKKIQNILRDHVYPVPNVEKHRIRAESKKGVIFLVEEAESPPIVVEKSVTADGKRVITKGLAPTRRSSETTRMTHSDFRDIVEHREEVLSDVLKQYVNDLGKVIEAPTEEIANLELRVSSDPSAPAVRDVVIPKEARDINQDLSAKTMSWLTDRDLPGSVETIYKFYSRNDMIEQKEDENYQKKMAFLFHASQAHYLPGTEWLIRYEGSIEELFEEVIEFHYNHRAILMLERVLLVLGSEKLLEKIDDDDRFDYAESKASEYHEMADSDILDRLREYTGKSIAWDGDRYPVSELFADEDLTEQIFQNAADECFQSQEAPKGVLRSIELVRLAQRESGIAS